MPTTDIFEVASFQVQQESSFLIMLTIYVLLVFYWM